MTQRRNPRPTQFPQTVVDCHKLILDLHAQLDQLEQRAARRRCEVAARRSVDGQEPEGTDRPLSSHAVFLYESDHNA